MNFFKEITYKIIKKKSWKNLIFFYKIIFSILLKICFMEIKKKNKTFILFIGLKEIRTKA